MNDAIELADAIAAELNAKEDFTLKFQAERGYLPRFDLEEMDDKLHVTVVPGGDTQTAFSRASDSYEFVTEVGIQQRFPGQPAGKEQLDPLMEFVQAVRDFFRKRAIETENLSAKWVSVEAMYSDDHLERLNQFSALLKFRHRIFR